MNGFELMPNFWRQVSLNSALQLIEEDIARDLSNGINGHQSNNAKVGVYLGYWRCGSWLIGWSADWLVCWLVALLRGCLVSVTWWPVGWLVGWLRLGRLLGVGCCLLILRSDGCWVVECARRRPRCCYGLELLVLVIACQGCPRLRSQVGLVW